jgi:hypothetical protein
VFYPCQVHELRRPRCAPRGPAPDVPGKGPDRERG